MAEAEGDQQEPGCLAPLEREPGFDVQRLAVVRLLRCKVQQQPASRARHVRVHDSLMGSILAVLLFGYVFEYG